MQQEKKPYTPATITLLACPADDLMQASPEQDEAFFGELNSFLQLM